MSSDLTCFINIAPSDGFLFTNSCNNDMLIYTESHQQNILIGTQSNMPAILHISSNQTSVYGNIVPFSNGTFSLGSPSLRFKDLFLTGSTLDIGGVQLKLDESSNHLAVRNSDGEYTRIIAQEIQLGSDSNAILVKIDPSNNSLQFLNVATSNGIMYSNVSSLSQWSNEGPALFTENVLLGVNTSNPQYELDVKGDINMSGTLLENGIPFLETRNIYASSSNIGIGLSNPEAGFTTAYDSTFKSNVTIFGILTVSNIQYVTSNVTILDTQIVNSNIVTLNTLTFSNQTGTVMLDSSNTNLGINTSSPEYTLDVNGDINFTGTLKQNGQEYVGSQWSNINNAVCILDSNVAIGTSNAESGFVSAVDATFRSNVTFLDSLSLSNSTGSLSIYSSNTNLGINTSSPEHTLDVNGDINFTGILKQNGSPYIGTQWSNASSNVFILASNIGINTSNPQFPLDIVGELNITGKLFKNGKPYTLSVDQSDSEVMSDSNINILKNDKNNTLLAKWASIIDGPGQESANAVTTDVFGNVFVAGEFENNNAFVYNHDGTTSITLSNSTTTKSAFVAKYTSNGIAQWAASVDGSNSDSTYAVTTDGSGNVYISGYYDQLVNIYNAGFQHSGFAFSNDYRSSYVVKYDSVGTAQWALNIRGSNDVNIYSLKTDSHDNLFVVGSYTTNSLPIYNADGTLSSITLKTTSGSDSACCIKYDSNGNALFAITIDKTNYKYINNIAIDQDDSFYIAGTYYSANARVYSSDNSSNVTLPPRTGFNSGFVVKCDSNGIAQWATALDKGTGLVVQVDSDKNVYLCGNRFEGPSTIINAGSVSSGITLGTPSALAGYVIKWDSNGTYQYHIAIEGPQANAVSSIFVKPSGELFVGGYYRTSCVIYENNTPSLVTLPAPGNVASFVLRIDTQGEAKSKIIIDGGQYDATNWIHVDSNNNLYIAGAYFQTIPTITNEDNIQSSVSLPLPVSQAAFLIKCEPKYLPSKYYLPSSNYERVHKYIVNTSLVTSALIKVQNKTNTATLYEFEIPPNQAQGLIFNQNSWHNLSSPPQTIGTQWSNASSNVFILASNVGINTSNPQFELDVHGDINLTGNLMQNGSPYIGSQWTTQSSNVYIIDSNIGIGLSNPTHALTVAGDVEFRSNIFLKNNTFVFRGLKVLKPASNDSITNITTTVNSVPGYTFSNNSLIFTGNQANFLINNSNVVTLSSNTKVGIKNSNPTYDLDVTGDINMTGVLRQNGSPYVGSQWSNINNAVCILDSNVAIGTSNAETGFVSAVNTTLRSNVTVRGNLAINSNITMSNATGSVSIFASNANIGIGKTNPQYKLDVQGDINFTGSLVQNGVVYGGGGSQTSTFSNVNFGNVHLTQRSNDLLVRNNQSNILLALSSNLSLYGGAPLLFENGASNINVSTALYGNARIVGPSPSQEGSIYLPGTIGSYFYCSNAALDFNWNGAGGCTMEYWANFTSFSGGDSVFMHGSPTNLSGVRDWDFGPNTSGNLNFFYFNYSGNTINTATSTVLATNTWYHLAFTTDSGRIRLFINGVLSATTLVIGIPFISPSSALIGLVMGSFYSLAGKQCFISNARIVVGAVAYPTTSTTIGTSVFTPSNSLGVHNSGTTVLLLKPQHGGKYIASSIDSSNAPAFTWSNDTNTGIYHPAQAQLAFTCGGSNIMTMSNTNVGIGLHNPSYKLDVVGDINMTGNLRRNGTVHASSQWSNASYGSVYILNSNIGINTTNPIVPLQVQGISYSTKSLINVFTSNFDINLPQTGTIGSSLTDRAFIEFSNSGYELGLNARHIVFKTSNQGTLGVEQMRLTSNGNLGVGISNPSYKLHVSGDIYATANVLAYSDSNYKDNIQVIPNALDKVDNITGYTFTFKEDPTSKRYAGLMAQEVQVVLPEVVSRDSNDHLSLAYGNTVALLVNAIKELRSEVKSLKANMSNMM